MSTTIHARLDDADAQKLEKIAKKEKRSVSWLVSQAVKLFLRKATK